MVSIRRKLFTTATACGLTLAASAMSFGDDETKPTEAAAPSAALKLALPTPKPVEEIPITLNVGSPAPAFVVGNWIKGEPVDSLKAGQVYVVEFWATWCGPCLAGMPHLSKLQEEYGDRVRIIGVTREKEEVVREWLPKEREEGVTWDQTVKYSMVLDSEDTMNKTWFRAAGRTGIPSAFIVGKDGVIEWIGHPARMDDALAKVVEGSWDRAAAKAAYDQEIEQMKVAAAARKAQAEITAAVREKDYDKALTLLEVQIEQQPENPSHKLMKLQVLGLMGNNEGAQKLIDEIVKADWDKGTVLGSVAMGMATKRYPGTLEDAEKLARRAVELTEEKNFIPMYYLGKILADQGKLDEAISFQRKAVELNETNALLLRTLRQYEKQKEDKEKGTEPPKDGDAKAEPPK